MIILAVLALTANVFCFPLYSLKVCYEINSIYFLWQTSFCRLYLVSIDNLYRHWNKKYTLLCEYNKKRKISLILSKDTDKLTIVGLPSISVLVLPFGLLLRIYDIFSTFYCPLAYISSIFIGRI